MGKPQRISSPFQAFTTQPSQQLAQAVSAEPLAVTLPRGTAGPGPILNMDATVPASHPAQGLLIMLPPALHRAPQRCWEWELGTGHSIRGHGMGDGHGGRSMSCLISLYPTGNLSRDNCPQPRFLAWKYPSLLHPLFPQYLFLASVTICPDLALGSNLSHGPGRFCPAAGRRCSRLVWLPPGFCLHLVFWNRGFGERRKRCLSRGNAC